MEIIIIEKKTFEQMIQSFADFAIQVKNLCNSDNNNETWLNNDAVCKLLQVSKRTMQSYRDNGTIVFSQIGHKCFYKSSDVEQFIQEQQITIQK